MENGSPNSADGSAGSRLVKYYPLSAAYLLFIVVAALTWRKWPSLMVDFGNELYMPWRITEGEVLYKDLAVLYGPFSKYFISFMFKIFGVSLSTVIYVNLAMIALLLFLLYGIFERTCGRLTAFASCVVFICVFALPQYSIPGSHNFLCPYAHESTHGVFLALLLIYLLMKFSERRNKLLLAAAGLALGALYMTKSDLCLSATGALAAWFGAHLVAGDFKLRGLVLNALVIYASAAAIILGFFIYFLSQMPAVEAALAVSGAVSPVFTSQVEDLMIFKSMAGLDAPSLNLAITLKATAAMSLLVFLSWAAVALAGRLRLNVYFAGAAFLFLFAAFLISDINFISWKEVPRSLPFFCGGFLIYLCRRFFKDRRNPLAAARYPALTAFCVFALLLLSRMGLRVGFSLGFYIAFPAAMVFVCMAVHFLPKVFSKTESERLGLKIVWLVLIVAYSAYCMHVSLLFYSYKNYRVGRGEDSFVTYDPLVLPQGRIFSRTVEWLDDNLSDDATMTVMPDGTMINYQLRIENPTPYYSFMPAEILAYGEDEMISDLEAARPDYILVVDRPAHEFRMGNFGGEEGFGKNIMSWVKANYRRTRLFGNEPNTDAGFGILVMEKK